MVSNSDAHADPVCNVHSSHCKVQVWIPWRVSGPGTGLPDLCSSPTTCQQLCNKDLNCQYFSYNTNPHSYLHGHCFFYKECHLGPATSEWVTYDSSLCWGNYMSYIYRLRRMIKKNYCEKYLLNMQELLNEMGIFDNDVYKSI